MGIKVRYVHDGSETTRDAISLGMEVTSKQLSSNNTTGTTSSSAYNNFQTHAEQWVFFRFRIVLKVRPVNDPPRLQLVPPTRKVIRIARGTSTTVTRDLFTVDDPDSDPADLQLFVRMSSDQQSQPGSKNSKGQTKSYDTLPQAPFYFSVGGIQTSNFTMLDVDSGKVSFSCVLQGTQQQENMEDESVENVRIVLSVEDGKSSGSSTVLVRVATFNVKLIAIPDEDVTLQEQDHWPSADTNSKSR